MEKCSIKKIKDFDFSQPEVIDQLGISQKSYDYYLSEIKKIYPNITISQFHEWLKKQMMEQEVFTRAMNKIFPCYEFSISEEAIQNVIKQISTSERLQGAPADVIRQQAILVIKKKLVFEDLIKRWNINVTDDEIMVSLRIQYQNLHSKQSFEEFKNNKTAWEWTKNILFESKVREAINGKLNFTIDWKKVEEKLKQS